MPDDENKRPQAAQIVQPTPRRPGNFSLTPLSSNTRTHSPSSPDDNNNNHVNKDHEDDAANPKSWTLPSRPSLSFLNQGTPFYSSFNTMPDSSPRPGGLTQKTQSILNLTSSTLFGIYSPSDYSPSRDEQGTPWGSGAQTPMRNGSFDLASARIPAEAVSEKARQKRGASFSQLTRTRSMSNGTYKRPQTRTQYLSGIFGRAALLFLMGTAYGEVVTRLHDTQEVAPVQVDGINRKSWGYLIFWGAVAVITGSLLPWLDRQTTASNSSAVFEESQAEGDQSSDVSRRTSDAGVSGSLGADWNPIVRMIGAFVGIAFAIRRLPWQSTLQVSLTLALVNPFIWYLIDRSRAGFALSTVVGISGAAALLSINPDVVPSPAAPDLQQTLLVAGVTSESIGVATWISSVLFCSCVCFGNLGRRLNRADVALS